MRGCKRPIEPHADNVDGFKNQTCWSFTDFDCYEYEKLLDTTQQRQQQQHQHQQRKETNRKISSKI